MMAGWMDHICWAGAGSIPERDGRRERTQATTHSQAAGPEGTIGGRWADALLCVGEMRRIERKRGKEKGRSGSFVVLP